MLVETAVVGSAVGAIVGASLGLTVWLMTGAHLEFRAILPAAAVVGLIVGAIVGMIAGSSIGVMGASSRGRKDAASDAAVMVATAFVASQVLSGLLGPALRIGFAVLIGEVVVLSTRVVTVTYNNAWKGSRNLIRAFGLSLVGGVAGYLLGLLASGLLLGPAQFWSVNVLPPNEAADVIFIAAPTAGMFAGGAIAFGLSLADDEPLPILGTLEAAFIATLSTALGAQVSWMSSPLVGIGVATVLVTCWGHSRAGSVFGRGE